MVRLEPAFDPAVLEEEARGLWKARGLPPPGGILGPRGGPMTLQFEGTFTPSDPESLVAHRAVAADVDARYLALAGRRALGTLRFEAAGAQPGAHPMEGILARLGTWIGGDGEVPWDAAARHERVGAMVGRLAHRGLLVSRDLPMRSCPVCGEPRSPEEIVYQDEEGETYLVRFNFLLEDRTVSALVWVDAPWRLLGTSALLVQPDLPYVIARCRRGSGDELVLTSRSSLERFHIWSPRATFETVEEHPGRYFEGRAYDYPLRHEFPTGGALPAPNGTILATPEVTDTGTGVVPLVPGHGSTDAEIAGARGVAGWPLVTPKGQLDLTLMHKYSGLDLVTGSEFILRDLEESEAIFARLKVRRGVPHCAACGSALLWIPGRAWCLEPSRFSTRQRAEYSRLLPDAPALDRIEVAPWPVSATGRHDVPEAIALLECSRCERLDALSGPVECACGARRFPVRRRLISSALGAFSAWARLDAFPVGAPVRLYVGDRRRVPALVHQLMALSAVDGEPGEVGLTVLPTVSDVVLSDLVAAWGADAVRAAYVRSRSPDRATGAFPDRCRVERDRLARLWSTVEEILGACDEAMLSGFGQPIAGFLGELETEDRALLARWERDRVFALTDYDHQDPASAYRRVFRFLETDLAQYRAWIRPRTSLPGSPTTKRAAFRTMVHLLRESMSVLGPICPHTADSVYRRLSIGGLSLFEGSLAPADRSLLSDELCTAWERWAPVIRAVSEFRRECKVGPALAVPSMALVVADDGLGDQLRADRPVLERLAGVDRIDIGSPRDPWTGRHGQFRPVESEIQRVYPSQATQIAHLLLARAPPRPRTEGSSPGELSVVIQGQTIRISPSMVEYVETLPAGFVPHPWSKGEMYLELPAGATKPDRIPPPLSPDADWLVRRLARRLRAARGLPKTPEGIAMVASTEPLTGELRRQSEAIARYLGLLEFRVVDLTAEQPPGRLVGRSRTGAPWWAHVPGLAALPRRTKHRSSRPRCRRVPVGPPRKPGPEVDFGAEDVLARSQAVRELGSQLDDILGAPLLGPTKVAHAWDLGFQSIEAYRTASFERLESLPGFGSAIVSLLTQRLGNPLSPPGPAAPRARSGRPGAAQAPATGATGASATVSTIAVTTASPIAIAEEGTPGTGPRTPSSSEPGPAGGEPAKGSEGAPGPTEVAPQQAPAEAATAVPSPEPIPLGPPAVAAPFVTEVPPGSETPPSVSTEPPEGAVPSGESGGETAETTSPQAAPQGMGEPPTGESVQPPTGPESGETSREAPEPVEPGTAAEQAESSEVPPGASSGAPGGADSEVIPAGSEPEPPAETGVGEPAPVQGDLELAPAEESVGISPEPGGPAPEETPEGELNMSAPPEEPTVTEPESEAPIPEGEEVASAAPPPEPEAAPTESIQELPVEPTEPAEGLQQTPEPPSEEGELESAEPSPGREGAEAAEPATLDSANPSPGAESNEEAPTTEPSPPSPAEVATGPIGPAAPAVSVPTVAPVPVAPIPGEVGTAKPVAEPSPAVSPETPSVAPPPAVAARPPAPSGIELEIGSSPFTSIQPFLDATAAGHRGVCLVRESPERVTAQVGPRPVDVYWLTNLGRGKTLRPSDLPGIFALLQRAIDQDHVTALFLEGIEYLVRLHGVEELIDRLTDLDRRARAHDARVWVHLTPDLLRPPDLKRMTAGLGSGPSA